MNDHEQTRREFEHLQVEGLRREVASLKELYLTTRASDKESIAIALVAADKAVNKAEDSAEKWRENANEWRGAMNDRERAFINRNEFEQWVKSTDEKFSRIERWMNTQIGNQGGHSEAWAYIIVAAGFAIAIASRFF